MTGFGRGHGPARKPPHDDSPGRYAVAAAHRPMTPTPRRARRSQSSTSRFHADGPSSALTGSTRQPPQPLSRGGRPRRRRCAPSAACRGRRTPCASRASTGPASRPTRHRSSPRRPCSVAWNFAIGHFRVYSSTNACHSGAAAVSRCRRVARARKGVVAVAHPDPDREARLVLVLRRGEVAVRRQVASVLGGAGLGRHGTSLAARPARLAARGPSRGSRGGRCCPARMSLTRNAVLARHRLLALGLRGLPDERAVGTADLEDHPGRDVDAAIGQGAKGGRQVERRDLDRAERAGQTGLEIRACRRPGSGCPSLSPAWRRPCCRPARARARPGC